MAWYDRHRRILPWRTLPGAAVDPYRVWLSEVMLQQTTVAAVGPYYQRFLQRWPNLESLACASLDDVRQVWAGLGYYRRAEALHECALRIAEEYNGQFPRDEAELLKLPGFGPYTAAAVAAIAFDRPANVVDGNVERVVARLFAVREPLPRAKPLLRGKAAELLPTSRHGDYAQALMDLGATLCTPSSPKCPLCPWKVSCRAFALGIADQLPRRIKREPRPVRRAIAFVLISADHKIFLRQRPKGGLLGGMMEVPTTAWETGRMPKLAEGCAAAPARAKWTLRPGVVKHIFSHFEFEIAVAVARVATTSAGSLERGWKGRWVAPEQLKHEALPSVMRKIVSHGLKLV